jgi:hypothetical protein
LHDFVLAAMEESAKAQACTINQLRTPLKSGNGLLILYGCIYIRIILMLEDPFDRSFQIVAVFAQS